MEAAVFCACASVVTDRQPQNVSFDGCDAPRSSALPRISYEYLVEAHDKEFVSMNNPLSKALNYSKLLHAHIWPIGIC